MRSNLKRNQFLAINLVIASFLLVPFSYASAAKTELEVNPKILVINVSVGKK